VLTKSFNSALRAALPPNIINALTPRQFAQVANPQGLMSPEGGASVLRGIGDPSGPGADLFIGAIRQALATSLHNVFWLSAALLVVVTVMLVLLLRDVPLRGRTDPGHVDLSHRTTEASIVQALQ
jgi:hypothetical protein